jgi:hypothetical protein
MNFAFMYIMIFNLPRDFDVAQTHMSRMEVAPKNSIVFL